MIIVIVGSENAINYCVHEEAACEALDRRVILKYVNKVIKCLGHVEATWNKNIKRIGENKQE